MAGTGRGWLDRLLRKRADGGSGPRRQDDEAMAWVRSRGAPRPGAAGVGHLVEYGLEHQGKPRENLDRMIAALQRGESTGWDEFSIDRNPEQPGEVEISFIREALRCDAGELLAALRELRAAWDERARADGRR